MNNFDKSHDGKLDETEFSKLVFVIDKDAFQDVNYYYYIYRI